MSTPRCSTYSEGRAADMDFLRFPPVVRIDGIDRAERAGDAGIADEDVRRTEGAPGGENDLLDVGTPLRIGMPSAPG